MKATSIFGGVQVFNIIISIIRSKFVAVLLGTTGLGIMGLLNSTIGILSSISNLGLNTSAVKDIASAYNTGDGKRIGVVVTVFRQLIWIFGVVGLIITALFSSWLSQLTFGNKDYSVAFVWLSLTLLLNQLSNGQLVVLQGLRKLNYLAKANILGSFFGLLITVPIYYIWRINGIVPGIICTAIISLLLTWHFTGKVIIEKTLLARSQTIAEGKNMLRMGFMISISGFLSLGGAYITTIFISRTGGIEQVGLYKAGFAIINTYIGLIFTAMATEYYPRLSTVAYDNDLCKQTINQQFEIALLIIAPILVIFITFIDFAIIVLYTKQFIAVNTMIYWAALGMFFKVSSWSISFIFLAKGTSKLYLWNELFGNLSMTILNIVCYKYWGLDGLGISFLVAFLLYFLEVYIISKIKFGFSFSKSSITIFIIQFPVAIVAFLTIIYINHSYAYGLGIAMIIFSVWYSLKELNKRLGLLMIFKIPGVKIK